MELEIQKPRKIDLAIDNVKQERKRIETEIALLQRESERLFKTLNMLEALGNDKQLQ